MYIRRRKSFNKILDLIRDIERDPKDLKALKICQNLILKEILDAESANLRHRARYRELTLTLKRGRNDRVTSTAIRTQLKRVTNHIHAQENRIFIWKCFGDALVYIYLDKFSIKHAFFDIDSPGVKQGAGMITGKIGLQNELHVDAILTKNVPAMLCDITNILRYGDICVLIGPDPLLIEIKTNSRLNQRGLRQIEKLEKLHSFLSTDKATDYRGLKGPAGRFSPPIPERSHTDAMNSCIASAKMHGQAIIEPEPGITYIAIYGSPDFSKMLPEINKRAKLLYFLNAEKNDHSWAPYSPFILSIRDSIHLTDFIEGRLFICIILDPHYLCEAMAADEWAIRFKPNASHQIQCFHRPTRAFVGVSAQFLARVGYEFTSLAWIAEIFAPSGATVEALWALCTDEAGQGESSDHEQRLRDFLGEDHSWIQEMEAE
ncbi:MAG: hypothetical protein JWM47_4464 [Acidimicrobiales bacterium]|nr:hypothetical protein [Acidimicrobiales bacterium]